MKNVVYAIAFIMFPAGIFLSCEKDPVNHTPEQVTISGPEPDEQNPAPDVSNPVPVVINQAPVAHAGDDATNTYPGTRLDGSKSTDRENNITSYQWRKISGPLSCVIYDENEKITVAFNLDEGVYQFELKVTDAGGLFDKDTVQITVNKFIVPCPPPQPSETSEVFNFLSQDSYPVREYTKKSSFEFYESCNFVLHYTDYGGFEYRGWYTNTDDVITFTWEGWSTAGPWGATGTLKGDTLTVRYNIIMLLTDFEDAVYLKKPK